MWCGWVDDRKREVEWDPPCIRPVHKRKIDMADDVVTTAL